MKRFNFEKWLLMLALVIFIQNGTVIVYNMAEGSDVCSGEEDIRPLSDRPYPNDDHT